MGLSRHAVGPASCGGDYSSVNRLGWLEIREGVEVSSCLLTQLQKSSVIC
jgi:hypothetical protein